VSAPSPENLFCFLLASLYSACITCVFLSVLAFTKILPRCFRFSFQRDWVVVATTLLLSRLPRRTYLFFTSGNSSVSLYPPPGIPPPYVSFSLDRTFALAIPPSPDAFPPSVFPMICPFPVVIRLSLEIASMIQFLFLFSSPLSGLSKMTSSPVF